MQFDTKLMDCSTSAKLRVYEVALMVGINFNGGHKAFLWAWLDKYSDEDVQIAVWVISHLGNPALLLELEAIILRATEPPYNAQIPTER
jgi:hypothetical protein